MKCRHGLPGLEGSVGLSLKYEERFALRKLVSPTYGLWGLRCPGCSERLFPPIPLQGR